MKKFAAPCLLWTTSLWTTTLTKTMTCPSVQAWTLSSSTTTANSHHHHVLHPGGGSIRPRRRQQDGNALQLHHPSTEPLLLAPATRAGRTTRGQGRDVSRSSARRAVAADAGAAVAPEWTGSIEQQQGSHSSSSSFGSSTKTAGGNRAREVPTIEELPVGATVTASTTTSSRGLTREQEVTWTFYIRRFRAAVRLRDQLALERASRGDPPPPEAEWADACGMTVGELRKVMQQGQAARGALVASNAGLVASIAKRHYQSLLQSGGGSKTQLRPTLADLVQEGNVGILAAAERYQPEKGFRFSTYATWWIRQRIARSISDSSRTIRLPAHVHSTLSRIHKARRRMASELGRDPTPAELARDLNMSVDKLRRYADSSRHHVVSLEVPLRSASSRSDRRTLGDVLASDAPTPLEHAQANSLRRDIQSVMENELAEWERHVISHRFGLEDGKPRSHAETAKLLGMSRDRVRLVEARALNKLRSPQRNYRLKEYVVSSPSASSLGPSPSSSTLKSSTAVTSRASSHPLLSSPLPEESSSSSIGAPSTSRAPKSDRIWFF